MHSLFLGQSVGTEPAPGRQKHVRKAIDRHGDPLPEDAIVRLGTIRLRHPGAIRSLALSPDGKRVASAGGKAVYLWSVATGELVRGHRKLGASEQGCLAFAPDGKTLVYFDNGNFYILDGNSGGELRHFPAAKGNDSWVPVSVAFSPDGKLLATGSYKGQVRLWKVATGEELSRLDGHHDRVFGVAFSRDGKTLASAGEDRTVRVWKVGSGKEIWKITGSEMVLSVAFSHDGKHLAWGDGASVIHLAEAAGGKEVSQFKESKRKFRGEGIPGLAFSPDDRLVIAVGGYWDATLRLWDVASGKEVRRFVANRADGYAFALSADGNTVALGGENNTVRLWDLAAGKEPHAARGFQGKVQHVAWSGNGKVMASAASDRVIRLWDTSTWKELRRLHGHEYGIRALAFSPGNKLLASAGNQDGLVCLWNAGTGQKERQFRLGDVGQQGVFAVCFSGDGKFLAAGNENTVLVWNVTDGTEVRRLKAVHPRALAFAPDRPVLAVADQGEGSGVWDIPTGRQLWRCAPMNTCRFLQFADEGRTLVAVDFTRNIAVRDAATGKELRKFQAAGTGLIASAALAPDGRTLLLGEDNDGGLEFWESASGKKIRSFVGHSDVVHAVAFAPDGRTAVSGSADTTALVWDLTGRAEGGMIPPVKLTQELLMTTWHALGDENPAPAHRALWTLVAAAKQSVPLLDKQLEPAPERKRLAILIAALNHERFAERQKATEALERLADLVEHALRKALAENPPLETARRLDQLLRKIDAGGGKRRRLQRLRALTVLEQIGTAEARGVLRTWAGGDPEAALTREAQAALQRLARRTTKG